MQERSILYTKDMLVGSCDPAKLKVFFEGVRNERQDQDESGVHFRT